MCFAAITDTKNTELRFIEHVTTGSGNKNKVAFSSALIAIANDDSNNPKAIQLTYLDKKTGAKIPQLPIAKRTLNSPTSAFVNLTPTVKTPQITFIAEGVETALSVRDATAKLIKNAQIVATLGKNNLSNIPINKIADRVVLVLDNDLKNPLDVSVKKAIQLFEEQGLLLKSLDACVPSECFYARYMDDWVILVKTKSLFRRLVKKMHLVMQGLKFKLARDKTFIGKISKGFDFLGYRFNHQGIVGLAMQTIQRFFSRILVLYEQDASDQRVREYVGRWMRVFDQN